MDRLGNGLDWEKFGWYFGGWVVDPVDPICDWVEKRVFVGLG